MRLLYALCIRVVCAPPLALGSWTTVPQASLPSSSRTYPLLIRFFVPITIVVSKSAFTFCFVILLLNAVCAPFKFNIVTSRRKMLVFPHATRFYLYGLFVARSRAFFYRKVCYYMSTVNNILSILPIHQKYSYFNFKASRVLLLSGAVRVVR